MIHRSHIIGLVLGIALGLFIIEEGRKHPTNDLPRVVVTPPN